jgi:hypothetical protein
VDFTTFWHLASICESLPLGRTITVVRDSSGEFLTVTRAYRRGSDSSDGHLPIHTENLDMKSSVFNSRGLLGLVGLLALAVSVGCQSTYGGQTLPSPYYLTDDVQYFAPGPEFKLANEAAAMKAASEEQAAIQGQP